METISKRKTHINLVVIGHVDVGKSTLAGHLIDSCNSKDDIDSDRRSEYDRSMEKAQELGENSLKYAWMLDGLRVEREKGLTMEASFGKFKTQKYDFTIIDTPGHRDFLRNMITGTSKADVAILMLAAPTGEFETGISKEGQTREHVLLANTLGVKQIIVCVNKMDDQTVNWSEARFKEIQEKSQELLKKAGYDTLKIPFIPISGFNGDNMIEKSPNLSWFEGPTLIEALETLIPPKGPTDNPLRIPVLDTYKIAGIGTVITGRIESGAIRPGMSLYLAPTNITTESKNVEVNGCSVEEAIEGENVCVNVKNISFREVRRGHVCGDPKNDPPRIVESFEAQIIINNHPGRIMAGYCPVIDCHTARVACKFSEIKARIDRFTGAVLEENPKFIKSGDSAIVTMIPVKPMCVESFKEYPPLGRFIAQDMRETVAVGIIHSIKKQQRKLR